MFLLLCISLAAAASAKSVDITDMPQLPKVATDSLPSVGDPILTFDPANIKPEETKKLIIKCQYNPEFPFGVSTLGSLTIGASSKEQPEVFEPLATVSGLTQTPKLSMEMLDRGAKSSAVFRANQKSEITLELDSPQEKDARVYSCVASGTDKDGHKKTVSKTGKVRSGDLSVKDLEEIIRKLEHNFQHYQLEANQYLAAVDKEVRVFAESVATELWSLKNDIVSLNRVVRDLKDKNEKLEKLVKIIDSDFHLSRPRDGRRYLVSKKDKEFSIQNGQDVCSQYGGYLVEVQNNHQLEDIVSLIREVGGESEIFYTGAKKETRDDQDRYIYQHSGNPVSDNLQLVKDESQPSGQQDCLIIKKSASGMSTALCSMVGRYICEIPIERQ